MLHNSLVALLTLAVGKLATQWGVGVLGMTTQHTKSRMELSRTKQSHTGEIQFFYFYTRLEKLGVLWEKVTK